MGRHDSDSDLKNVRALDAMVSLMIELDRRYNGQGMWSWKFMGR